MAPTATHDRLAAHARVATTAPGLRADHCHNDDEDDAEGDHEGDDGTGAHDRTVTDRFVQPGTWVRAGEPLRRDTSQPDTRPSGRTCSTRPWSTRRWTSWPSGPGAAPLLELGIGTGRLALPLSRRGVPVHGIELSDDMVAQLRAKPGSRVDRRNDRRLRDDRVPGALGPFTLAYLVRNTIMNLTTQDEQVACFRNVAAHLAPGGSFVMEVVVPELPASSARGDRPRLHGDADASRLRRVRRGDAGPSCPTTTG